MSERKVSGLKMAYSFRAMSPAAEQSYKEFVPGTDFVINLHMPFDAGWRRHKIIYESITTLANMQTDHGGMTPEDADRTVKQTADALADATRYDRFIPGVPALDMQGLRPMMRLARQDAIRFKKESLEAAIEAPEPFLLDTQEIRCRETVVDCVNALAAQRPRPGPPVPIVRPVPGSSLTEVHVAGFGVRPTVNPAPGRPASYAGG